LNLTTAITHTFPGDLDMTLTSPEGTVVTISTDNGGGSDDAFNGTIWDDSAITSANDFVYTNGVPAPSLVVEGAMGAFIGENPNGTWSFDVFDDAGGDTGTLASWGLDVTTCAGAPMVALPVPGNNTLALFLLTLMLLFGAFWGLRTYHS